MSKKLIFLTCRLPFPTTSGRKNVMYYYCKYLQKKFGYDIINISFLEDGDDVNEKPDFVKKVYTLDDVSTKVKLNNFIKNTVIKKKYPMQVSLYYDDSIKNKINEIIELEKPDLIIADMVRMTEYLKDYDINKIADLDDLISIRYERQLQSDLTNINPYGAYLDRLPKVMQKTLSIEFFKRKILKLESSLLSKYEVEIANIYDAIVFVAEKEAVELNSRANTKKCFAVPLGVDTKFFEVANNMPKEKNSISFLGALNVAHNETAVINFCENILPIIISKNKDVKFYIIGGGATENIKKYQSDNVIITGRVDDVREAVGKTEVFVAPLVFGSGIKTKIIEAMAMGVAVVTTDIGAESISAINEQDWYIENDNNKFADRVIELLADKELNDNIRRNGYLFSTNNFEWDAVSEKWTDVFKFMKI